MPLKAIVRGHSYAVIPISWTNRSSGESKLGLSEMGSRYLYIMLYMFLEDHLAAATTVAPTLSANRPAELGRLAKRPTVAASVDVEGRGRHRRRLSQQRAQPAGRQNGREHARTCRDGRGGADRDRRRRQVTIALGAAAPAI